MVDKVKKKKVVKKAVAKKAVKKTVTKKAVTKKAVAKKAVAKKAVKKAVAKKAVKKETPKNTSKSNTSSPFMETTKKGNFKDRAKKGFGTKKKAPGTLKKIAKVAGKTLRSPVGKFGIPGALATAAYFGYKEFAGKKKKPVAKKPTPKKKAPIKKRKLSPGESKIRKSDIMGGSKGRLSGPKGPLGGKLDKRKKSTVVKNRNKRFNPRKANRAGQKFGQR